MKNSAYDPEELELLDFIENEIPDSVPEVIEEMQQLKFAVKDKLNKRKAIN